MTTAINDDVIVQPNGLVRCCAWCLPLIRLAELHKQYRCSDGICPDCQKLMEREVA
jgi:hypothetical protein